jgi:hypothetical protein
MTRRFGPRAGEPCTSSIPRCEFWTWGADYVRPACCTTHLIRLAEFTHELLDRHGIRHWLDYGSLLGVVRNGRLVPWDSDVDLGILAEDVDRVIALAGEIASAGHRLDASAPDVLRITI